MVHLSLPISKSIANRLLLLQAIHGDELMPVSAAMPDVVLHNCVRIKAVHHSRSICITAGLHYAF